MGNIGDKIHSSGEDYLEAIYNLSQESERVRSVDVANMLGVTRPSVNKAMSVLLDEGMIEKEPYGEIMLTQKGRERAIEVTCRHRLLKLFLTSILEVDEHTAEEDACKMEHVISDATMNKLTAYLEKNVLK